MKKLKTCCVVLSLAMFCFGCTSILEGSIRTESLHVAATNERPPDERLEVSNYEEISAAILSFIMQHETAGMMVAYSYSGDIYADISTAILEIMTNDSMAVFSVASIDEMLTRIHTFFEIDLHIEYKRTKEQMDSIIGVSTLRSLRAELLRIMSEYRDEAVFLTSLMLTEEDMANHVRETYYQNPRSIVMLPVTVVEMFTAGGDDRFIELRFAYIGYESRALSQLGASLAGSVRMNARRAVGENDAEILLSLVENLIGACNFDVAIANTISEHGVQNIAATAYGALATGNASGEGFAMAFKALCDELGIDCIVVLGHLDGRVHAWNIVSLFGDNYHIDAAICALYGVETAFFKTDADFSESYSWDTENTVKCNGMLTYRDIVGADDDAEDAEDGENGENGEDGENGESNESGADGSQGNEGSETEDGADGSDSNGSDGETGEPDESVPQEDEAGD